ncbi:MAG: tRNA (adenosine(37)-N6)-threonylcarbamoyltransferase complex ATPase subunit type 1 TsaE [Minisyncoccia bacterium]
MFKRYITKNPKETKYLGKKLGLFLQKKFINKFPLLLLKGKLGAGKTVFVKGLANSFKVSEEILSPTFIIFKKYYAKIENKKITFCHIDCYRIKDEEEFKKLKISDFFQKENYFIVIEWPERIKKLLKDKNYILVEFRILDIKKRKIKISFKKNG